MDKFVVALVGFIMLMIALCGGFYLISDVFSLNFSFRDLIELSIATSIFLSVIRLFFVGNVQP